MPEHGTVGIIGAGTMGAGIAQVAAAAGWTVRLFDVDPEVAPRAIDGIDARFKRLVEKGRLTADEAAAAHARLEAAMTPAAFADADLVIEAIVEDLNIKVSALELFLPHLRDDAIVATNTSSLSVSELGTRLGIPERVVGMHFFNPAPILRLVEIIAGDGTSDATVDRAASIAQAWGKVTARAADVPGFIVNHVARPFYLEAFRLMEDGIAGPEDIDQTMTARAGFRMGPLTLTDLIGQDINTATTRSVWEQLDQPALLEPSMLQEKLAEAGQLGRKSGAGIYRYDTDPPVPNLGIKLLDIALPADALAAVRAFAGAATSLDDLTDTESIIITRILVGLFVQAEHAVARGVADAAAIDTALVNGTNYPQGPFAWAAAIGDERYTAASRALSAQDGGSRFARPTEPASRT